MNTLDDQVARMKALREAFAVGVRWSEKHNATPCDDTVALAAARHYPMPTVAVSRVVNIGGVQFRSTGGVLQSKTPGGTWEWTAFSSSELRTMQSLIDDPIEMKPADEVDP